jgi:lon-related putative ATP-dependent protease
MAPVEPLTPEALCTRCDPGQFSFQTTAELEDLTQVLGQARAVEALRFGIGIRRRGYNLFVLGEPGTGRHSVVRQFLTGQAAGEPVPSDWCYVNNFSESHKPRVLRLPAGTGVRLKRDIEQLMNDLRAAIPAAFESEEYRTRRQELEEKLKEQHESAFEELRLQAEAHGLALIRTPSGMAFAPTRKGEVLGPEEYEKLPEAERQRLEAVIPTLEEQLAKLIHQIPQWRREGQQRIRELDREVTMSAVVHLIDELRKAYAALPAVLEHLDTLQQAVIDNADDFRHPEEGQEMNILGITLTRAGGGAGLRRFQVNALVDHSATRGAPVVYEDNPTFAALIGRIEHIAQMGALVTDFMLIKPGALHRANGGYLMLDARKVLLQPFAWEALKRALSSREARIESLGQALSLVSTVSLEPEPIPLELKVVLIGEPLLYYLLAEYDPEFTELFKVAVDFGHDMQRDAAANLLYARLIATLARREDLLALDRAAVARVIEHAARLVEDAGKLTARLREITDLLREADHWAREAQHGLITAADVGRAIDARIYRMDRIRERFQEIIERGTILIDTGGERIGQVNGLSVVELGEFAFGHPSRITANVRLGKGEVLDIQREVELAGPIHSKGVLILSGFLGARYAADRPLALSASLVFEQTYGEVEGDSASSAELYALLSSLAAVPIRQSLAVTGSVNQHGEVQAIGGVNEKIEGFFDLCRARGLSGEQGVLIPVANVRHLMLRHDVIEAVRAGQFRIYPVRTIDEGIELLTGMPAGERDANGLFPDDTLNQRVELRLIGLSELARAYGAPPTITGEEEGDPA